MQRSSSNSAAISITFNTFSEHLFRDVRKLCPSIATKWAMDSGVTPSPIHGDADFAGNECSKLLKSVHILRRITPTSQVLSESEIGHDDMDFKHVSFVFEAIHQLCASLDSLNLIIERTMTPKLDPDWLTAFKQFDSDFQSFAASYLKLYPRHKHQSLTPPKFE
jgi:hypothetical protein